MADILCLGEALIDFVAVNSGKTLIEVTAFKKVAGGAPANVSVGVSKLGRTSAFLGRVGDDEFGYFLRDTIKRNGVDVSQMQFDKKARTGLAFISLPTPNTREFLFYRNPSADMMMDSSKFDNHFISSAKVFHFGSITLIGQPSRSSTMEAAELAKDGGAIISYDPNLRLGLWPDREAAKQEMKKPLGMVDIVKVNDDELDFLTGESDCRKGMDRLLDYGPKLAILTLGEKGSCYRTAELFGKVESFKVDTVDATGCGDSFVAGLLCGMLDTSLEKLISDREMLEPVLRFASAAAAITSTRKGVIGALPRRKKVMDFLKDA
ncbi:MAG: PfkB family carbohydrate kinase [Actinomycetota bacterium]